MKREALLRERRESGSSVAAGNGKGKEVPAFELSKLVSILSLKKYPDCGFLEIYC